MPDLGAYQVEVLAAYGVSLLLLAAIVLLTWLQARSARRKLDEVETRGKGARRRQRDGH